MNTHDIELPPLPSPFGIVDPMGSGEKIYTLKDMGDYARAYARAAVEADRRRRGEPTAAEISDVIREITGCPDIKNGEDSLVVALGMLFHRGATTQPAEPSDSLPRHVAQTLATAIYETAQKMGIANGDHSALSVPQCLHLLDCMAQPAEPVKVPSVDEIMDAVMAYGSAHSNPQTTATERHARLNDVRALLARYGKGTP